MKRSTRVAGWVVLAGLVIFFGLAGRGLSSREYSFEDAGALRKSVAGRWDWSTRAVPCSDSAHTIAFSDDGTVMTITSQMPLADSAGRDLTVATYDISAATGSRVRGAIRGESRRTGEGTPVVWELVMLGTDRYTWHRTDWASWSHTADVVRCPAARAIADADSTTEDASTAADDLSSFYRGEVVNNQLPGRKVALELSIFERGDSSTVAWLESGKPLDTEGLTWVLLSGDTDSLYLVTAAATGDTIVWASESRVGPIGGQFWVSSGPNVGQGGSWRLEPAPHLGVNTLVLFCVIMAVAILVGILALATFRADRWWSRRLQRRPLQLSPAERAKFTGIGGWLVLVVFGQSMVALMLIARIGEVPQDLTDLWMMGSAISFMRPMLIVESGFHVFQLLAIIIGLVLIFRKSPMTPLYWIAVLVTMSAYGITDLMATSALRDAMITLFGPDIAESFDAETAEAMRLNSRLALTALVWALYWERSRRVATVFAPRVMDGGVAPPSAPVKTDFSLPSPQAGQPTTQA